jgi:hypothetical protein
LFEYSSTRSVQKAYKISAMPFRTEIQGGRYCERRDSDECYHAAKECAEIQREILPHGRINFTGGGSSLGSFGRKLAAVGIFADKR